jgi:hypothetical protein
MSTQTIYEWTLNSGDILELNSNDTYILQNYTSGDLNNVTIQASIINLQAIINIPQDIYLSGTFIRDIQITGANLYCDSSCQNLGNNSGNIKFVNFNASGITIVKTKVDGCNSYIIYVDSGNNLRVNRVWYGAGVDSVIALNAS